MAKTPSARSQADKPDAGPAASRPRMPAEYGVPKDEKGLLPWSHVTERMARANHYWICTVGPTGQPHATPVDGLWVDDALYFGGSAQTRRQRNLAQNPAACIHLESAMDVVMLHGEARQVRPDHALAVRLAGLSKQKYGYAPKPEEYEKAGVHVFRPRVAFAWSKFPKDVTRWRFAMA